jgi:hypothetical protein
MEWIPENSYLDHFFTSVGRMVLEASTLRVSLDIMVPSPAAFIAISRVVMFLALAIIIPPYASRSITLSQGVIILMCTLTPSQAVLQASTTGTCFIFSSLATSLNTKNTGKKLELHTQACSVAYLPRAANPFLQDFPETVCMDPH